MAYRKVTPRVREETAEWYAERWRTSNAGYEYALSTFPALYDWALERMRGTLTYEELVEVIDWYTAQTDQMSIKRFSAQYDAIRARIESLDIPSRVVLDAWASGFYASGLSLSEYTEQMLNTPKPE